MNNGNISMKMKADLPVERQVAIEHAASRNEQLLDLLEPITAQDLVLGDNGTLDTVIECPKLDWSETINHEWAADFRTDDFNIDFELVLDAFCDEISDAQIARLDELGLSFEPIELDFNTQEITFEFLFSWGGPSEALRFTIDADGKDTTPSNIEFIFKEWFKCQSIEVNGCNFTGLTEFAFRLAEFAHDRAHNSLHQMGLV